MVLVELNNEIDKLEKQIKEKREMQHEIELKMEELKLRKTLLKAELIGLEQQSKALAEVVATMGAERGASSLAQAPPASDLTKLTLVDAVEYVINESAEPLRIVDVRRRLQKLGRDDDGASVGVTLHYAATNRKICRVARGLYARLR